MATLRSFLSLCSLLLCTGILLGAMGIANAALPDAKTGGKAGGPISVLFILGSGANGSAGDQKVDPKVEADLTSRGFLVRTAGDKEPLTAEYLRQFNTVVVVGLEDFAGGGYYGVGGVVLLNTRKNVELLQQYVADGGGLVFIPVMAGMGSQVADTYNTALAPWKLRIGWETVRDDANQFTDKELANYVWTRSILPHPATEGVKALAYPDQLMRWDDAYATNPLMPEDPAWQVLARGEQTSQGMRNVSYKWAAAESGTAPALAAAREAGKGRVAVVGLGGYYLVSQAFFYQTDEKTGKLIQNMGEDTTGFLNGIAYAKGDGKTPSDWGKLFTNLLCWTAEHSAQAGLGGKPETWTSKLDRIETPANQIPDFAPVNWKTQLPPPTWAHHLPNFRWWRGTAYYDEGPDPLVVHAQQMNKILVGAHSAYSDGKGTVADWAKAAKAAGFNAVVFTERFANINGANWPQFIEECKANSTPEFACLQGMDIPDTFGNRFLVLGNTNFPSGGMLTPDGKALDMTARLSLGFSGHIAVVHRLGHNAGLPTELTRHFQGITVYTYAPDGKGGYGLADDAFSAYTWQLYNASNPVPIVVHELYTPAEVAKNGTIGFQQIVPAQDAQDAIRYFRYGIDHFFENPQRYFITDGPIIDGYSIFNKDIGSSDMNRDHWRATIGASSPDPTAVITEATLYDRGTIARRWTPKTAKFSATIDGEHSYQRYFMLVVTDSNGHRAIAPHLRTVERGYFTRCGDRQNWFGAAGNYTGIWPSGTHGINYIYPSVPAGADTETFYAKQHPLASKMSLPFASNALTFTDFTVNCKYINPTLYGMDAWRIENVIPTTTYEAYARVGKWHDIDTSSLKINVLTTLTSVDAKLRMKMNITPTSALFPAIQGVDQSASYCYLQDGKRVEGKLDRKAETLIDLPAGASIGNYFLLTPLTVSGNGGMGWRAIPGQEIKAGTEWSAAYLYLPVAWRADAGADGPMPWTMKLSQGKISVLGTVNLTADKYGVAGTLKAGGTMKMLPLKVSGLQANWPAALWTDQNMSYEFWSGLGKPVALPKVTTSGPPFLTHIGVCDHIGYAAIDNTHDAKFYVGNTLMASNQNLVLAYRLWTRDEADIEVNNPTDKAITADLTSAPIPGRYRVKTKVTVPAGSSVYLTLPKGKK